VTVGAEMVAVPQLIGVPYNQVLGISKWKEASGRANHDRPKSQFHWCREVWKPGPPLHNKR